MAQFIKIKALVRQDAATNTRSSRNMCLCCLVQNKTMINLMNCEHNEFLQEYLTMGDPKALICEICHNMLVKICIFKMQVAESNRIMHLNLQELQTRTKLCSLEKSDMIVTSTGIDTEYTEFEIKKEPEKEHAELDFNQELELTNQCLPCEIGTDIKIKEEKFENDISSDQIKTNETQNEQIKVPVANLKKRYIGKIVDIIISREELMEEREKESKKEFYLKMPFKCETCIKGFSYELLLKLHNEKLHNMNKGHKYLCDICKTVFASEVTLRCHTKRHMKRFVCIPCGKHSTNVASLIEHFNQQHGDACGVITTQFQCRQCEYTTDSRLAYNKHLQAHKRSQCNICDKTLSSKTSLRMHINSIHKGLAQYACSICDKSFTQKMNLILHTEKEHKSKKGGDVVRQKAYCEKCRTYYADKSVLRLHLRNHSAHITDEKKFSCQECGAKFVTRSHLKYHVEWDHLKIIKYKCKTCSKAFKSLIILKKHELFVHEKKRPPRNKICDYCGRAFFSTTILVTHIRTHTGDRPEKCTHCDATFTHSAALYNHNKHVHKILTK